MPLGSLKLRPGVNVEATYTLNEAGISTSQLIRFKNGLPQTYGGWQYFYNTALAAPPRCILSWIDLNGGIWTAVGTDTNAQVFNGGTLTNITPNEIVTNTAGVQVQATMGSPTITFILPAPPPTALTVGNQISITNILAIGGLLLNGAYTIASVINTMKFTITAAFNATVSENAAAQLPEYTTTLAQTSVNVKLVNHGLSMGSNWNEPMPTIAGGVTIFGSYIVASVVNANNFTINIPMAAIGSFSAYENNNELQILYYFNAPGTSLPVTFWTMDHFGETLLACPGAGPIYSWTPNTGQLALTIVSNAPTVNGGIFLAMPAQILVAWASSVNGAQQPNLINWSDQQNYTVWAPSVTNQAGNASIPTGSRIMRGFQAPNQALIFTDIDLYSMNYLGAQNTELVFGFLQISNGCGLLASRGVGVLNGIVWWISPGQFFMLDQGTVSPVPCTVWDEIFQDLDTANLQKIVCGTNTQFGEVAWFFPSLSGGTGDCDSYVKFNPSENAWDYGKLSRTAWQDYSAVNYPLGGDVSGYLYEHENGYTAAGSPLNWSWGTGAFTIADGDQMAFVDWFIPDFRYGFINAPSSDASVNLVVSTFRYPGDTAVQSQTLTCSASGPGELSTRMRGRVMTLTASGTGFARLGNLRFRAAPDGKY